MRTFLRLIAVLLLILFVLLFPVSLLMRNVGNLIFNPETTKAFIQEALLSEEFLARTASQAIQGVLTGNAPDDATGALIQRGLEGLDESDWEAITSLVAPAPLLTDTADSVVDAVVAWLDSDDELPSLALDLRPWKRSINQNATEIVIRVMDALPACTVEEMGTQILEGLGGEGGLSEALPLCRPPDPLYTTVLQNSGSMLGQFLVNAPDEIDLKEFPIQGLDQLQSIKAALNQARLILTWSWVILLLVALMALLLAARTVVEALRWSGWPAMFAGITALVLGLGLQWLSGGLFVRLLQGALGDVPLEVSSALSSVAGEVFTQVGRPLSLQALLLIGFGLVALLSAFLIERRGASG